MDQFWSQVGTNLDTCWCHFGELCVASTASADMSKTIKNQWFFNDFNDFAMSEGSEKRRKHHLVAKRHRDSQHSSQMTSKSVQFWSQNGTKIGPKMVSEMVLKFALVFGLLFGPKPAPKMTPNWSQNEVSCPDVLLEPQAGPKTDPKWLRGSQHGPKMAPKWLQNVTLEPEMDTQMEPKMLLFLSC